MTSPTARPPSGTEPAPGVEPLTEQERAEALKLARTAVENPLGVDMGLLSPGFALLARFALDAYEENRKLRGDLRSRSPNPAAPVAPATDGEPINLALQSSIERMELFVRGAPLARGETTLLRPDAKHLLSEIRRLTEAYQKVLAERDALARWKDKATPALMRKALLESEVARLREDALTPEEAGFVRLAIGTYQRLGNKDTPRSLADKLRRIASRLTAGTGEER